MWEHKFSKWVEWEARNKLDGINYPGIYVCRISERAISGSEFSWHEEIMYVGMSNAQKGIKDRLKQFDTVISGKGNQEKPPHGGADRVRYKYPNYQELISKLFVSIAWFKCDVKSKLSDDLTVMGDVAKFEYDCWAQYVRKHGVLPEFNDRNQAPKKYSKTHSERKRRQ